MIYEVEIVERLVKRIKIEAENVREAEIKVSEMWHDSKVVLNADDFENVEFFALKTENKYWIFLEKLRRSGKTNMFGATPYLMVEFGLDEKEAREILNDWMKNYNREDYEES